MGEGASCSCKFYFLAEPNYYELLLENRQIAQINRAVFILSKSVLCLNNCARLRWD
jgi:hypothetical protein